MGEHTGDSRENQITRIMCHQRARDGMGMVRVHELKFTPHQDPDLIMVKAGAAGDEDWIRSSQWSSPDRIFMTLKEESPGETHVCSLSVALACSALPQDSASERASPSQVG